MIPAWMQADRTVTSTFIGAALVIAMLSPGLQASAPLSASIQLGSSTPGNSAPFDAVPSREWSPYDVVRIQLEALRGIDATDRGIATAFRFASPANKVSTGPLVRFGRMLRSGLYSLMLRYTRAVLEPKEISGDRARVRVLLVNGGEVRAFEFYLSRQRGGVCDGFWMTDAVLELETPGWTARAPVLPHGMRMGWRDRLLIQQI